MIKLILKAVYFSTIKLKHMLIIYLVGETPIIMNMTVNTPATFKGILMDLSRTDEGICVNTEFHTKNEDYGRLIHPTKETK